ncbi:MAG: AMP-binding protein, partial [Caedimonadaceae bacterium]
VGPDTLVAIAVERSLEMVIALLGILKAGGAYVPLDSDYPSDRLQFMLEDTNASLLITQSFLQDKLDSLLHSYSGKIVFLDRVLIDNPDFFYHNVKDKHIQNAPVQTLSSYPSTNPTTLTTPLNLAYVIYTSGSTGMPKGVEIEHREVVNYLYYALNQYDAPTFGTTLLHSPVVFDMSITSLFYPLSRGDKLALLQHKLHPDDLLLSLKNNQDITFVKLTPSHLHTLKEELPSLLSPQRLFIIGGENLLQEDIMPDLKKSVASHGLIINEYGPTEATVGCSVFSITSSTSLPMSASIPIGTPISNVQIYILDEQMQPVPIGVRGEIYIGGEGLARGYLNRPD